MPVPKAHITPRLESLPKELRATAESIIKKHFSLVKPKEKPIEKVIIPDRRDFFVDPRSIAQYNRIDPRDCNISVNGDSIRVESHCYTCRSAKFSRVIYRDDLRGAHMYSFASYCGCCGACNEITLDAGEMLFRIERHQIKQMQQKDPREGWLVPPNFQL